MDKLTWTFQLADRMSGPASKMDRSLGRLNQTLHAVPTDKISDGFKKVEGSARKAADSSSKLADGGFSFASFATGLAAAGAIAAGFAAAGAKWMVSSLVFKENTLGSLESMLKSKDAAERVFKMATKFAADTPFSSQQVGAAFEKLVAAGYKENELQKMMTGIGDLAAGDAQKVDRALMAISQIKGKGKMQGEELMQLAEMGLPIGQVLEQLAKSMGKTKDEVQSLMSAGKISADQGIGAIMATVNSTFGGRMERASKSLSGLWSTLQAAPGDILMGLDMEPMIGPIKSLLTKGIALLGPDAPGGKLLAGVFTKAGEIIGKVADTVSSIDFAKWFDKIGTVASKAWPLVEKFFAGFGKAFGLSDAGGSLETVLDKIIDRLNSIDPATIEKLGVFFGYAGFAVMKLFEWSIRLAIGLGGIVDSFMAFWMGVVDFGNSVVNDVADFFDVLPSRLFEIGVDMMRGLGEGMAGGIPGVSTVVDSLGDGLIDKMKAKLGIQSPSTVFAEIGNWTGLGFLQGLEGSGMNQAIANPITPGQVAAGAAASGGGAPSITIANLAIHVGDGVKDVAQAREHGKAAADSFGAQMTSFVRRLATEVGG